MINLAEPVGDVSQCYGGQVHIEFLWAMTPCILVGVFCCVTSYRCVRRHILEQYLSH